METNQPRTPWRNVASALEILYPPLAGAFFGMVIDSKYRTGSMLTLGLVVMGVVLSIYNLFKLIREYQKDFPNSGT